MRKIINNLTDIWEVFSAEVRRVFSDKLLLLVFFVATVLYPLVFSCIYFNELVVDMRVAVVDESQCEASKRFSRKIDATPELTVAYRPATLEEAKQLMRDHKVHAIFYIPRDFASNLAEIRTARIAVFCDMSSFLYYKNALLGGNDVLIDEMHTIELERFGLSGMTGKQADNMLQPVVYDDVKLYNPAGGFASFFLPALMMLVVHQTLFIGICIICGDDNENRRALRLIPPRLRTRSIYRVTFGRALCFILIYIPITMLDLWLIPHLFHMPQLGALHDLLLFLLPFVLAVTFFSMTFGNIFVKQKLSAVLCCVFFSVVLFFISGVVWPQSNMPRFWLAFSYIFPSTPGVEGYVRISTMGATLSTIRREYLALWLQTGVYFLLSCESLRFIKRFRRY